MGTSSFFWFILFATIGGAFVFVGLLMEQSAEKKMFKDVGHLRHCKSRKLWGEWFVIIGVFGEVVLGGISAAQEWKKEQAIEQKVTETENAVTNLPTRILKAEEEKYNGALIPANDPFPPLPYPGFKPPPKTIALILGNSVSLAVWFPHTVILYKGQPALTISTNSQGATISADFFDSYGMIVASIETNEFHINPLNSFRIERPDKSTLKVKDLKNEVILDVRFLNPQEIEIDGILRFPNGRDVVIDQKEGMFSGHVFFGLSANDVVIP